MFFPPETQRRCREWADVKLYSDKSGGGESDVSERREWEGGREATSCLFREREREAGMQPCHRNVTECQGNVRDASRQPRLHE